jgi:hypothetical protein
VGARRILVEILVDIKGEVVCRILDSPKNAVARADPGMGAGIGHPGNENEIGRTVTPNASN